MTGTRQRGTSLAPAGIEKVRAKVSQLRWTQLKWSIEASVSRSTLKRLLNGERVDLIEAPIQALGLEVEDLIFQQSEVFIPLGPIAEPASSRPNNPDFYMRVNFTETNRRQIGYALDDLRELLVGQKLEITPSTLTSTDTCVVISSDFPEHLRAQVLKVLQHLESLSMQCVVKGDIAFEKAPRSLTVV
jgi:hypothetical protein